MSLSRAAFAAMLSDQPLLLSAGGCALAQNVLADMSATAAEADAWYFTSETQLAEGRPYRLSKDGIAVIPVEGLLVHKLDAHYPGWFTGYGYIENLLDRAMNDSSVKGIVFDVNSPGGMVSGCFELCDSIVAARGTKPMAAVVDASGYSAAYAIASSANMIIAAPSAGVGSIGVITMHVDVSRAMENAGVKITMLYKGKHKAEGSPYEPLSADVRERIEASLEKSYTQFVNLVSRNRGLEAEAVRATEASTYDADEALSLGLVDAVTPPREAVASFVRELSGSTKLGGSLMSAAPTENTDVPAAGEPNAAAAAPAAPVAAATDTVAAERARIADIMGCDEAKGRDSLANHLAFKTDMSADEARALLAAAPVNKTTDTTAEGDDPLARAMASTEQPEVGADGGAAPSERSAVDTMLGDYAAATGYKPVVH